MTIKNDQPQVDGKDRVELTLLRVEEGRRLCDPDDTSYDNPPTPPHPQEEEEEDAYVLLTASKFQRIHGRGRRPNWFYRRGHVDCPFGTLDGVVWRRFQTNTSSPPVKGRGVVLLVFGLVFMFLFGVGYIWDAIGGDVPVWFALLLPGSMFTGMGVMSYMERHNPENEAKGVAKMQKTMAKQGYAMEYFETHDCRIFVCSYVRFSRIPNNMVLDERDPRFVSKSADEAFDSGDWAPLQGTWVGRAYEAPDSGVWARRTVQSACVGSERAYTFTTGVENEGTFTCQFDGKNRGGMVGNMLKHHGANLEDIWSGNLPVHPESMRRLSNYQEDLNRHGDYYRIIGDVSSSSSNRHTTNMPPFYYRNTTGSTVWKVEGSKMVHFVNLEDEWLSDEDILGGCLSTADEDREWYEFERNDAMIV